MDKVGDLGNERRGDAEFDVVDVVEGRIVRDTTAVPWVETVCG